MSHPLLTDGQRSRLIATLASMYEGARDAYWREAETITELLLGYPSMDRMTPDEFRKKMEELL